MDAILDQLDCALDVAFGLGNGNSRLTQRHGELSQLERARAQSRENAAYELQIGDGVCDAHYGNPQGIIREIDGNNAAVDWMLPMGGFERESVPLDRLAYQPTLEQIYGKDPNDKQAIRNDDCETVRIQREWNEIEERNRNCYPTPEIQAVAKLNQKVHQIKKSSVPTDERD